MDLQRTTERPPGRDAADPVVALASELVRCPSVTPEDAGCQDWLAARLEPLGFTIEKIVCGNVANLLRIGGRGLPGGTTLLRLLVRHGRRQPRPSES